MKTKCLFRGESLLGVLAVLALASCGSKETVELPDEGSAVRIGVYDSRAIAVAYAGSPGHEKAMAGMMAEHAKAKNAGDDEVVAKLEAMGKEKQAAAHQQAFGTASVDDILNGVRESIAEMKESMAEGGGVQMG